VPANDLPPFSLFGIPIIKDERIPEGEIVVVHNNQLFSAKTFLAGLDEPNLNGDVFTTTDHANFDELMQNGPPVELNYHDLNSLMATLEYQPVASIGANVIGSLVDDEPKPWQDDRWRLG